MMTMTMTPMIIITIMGMTMTMMMCCTDFKHLPATIADSCQPSLQPAGLTSYSQSRATNSSLSRSHPRAGRLDWLTPRPTNRAVAGLH